jgi:hypothetical protein
MRRSRIAKIFIPNALVLGNQKPTKKEHFILLLEPEINRRIATMNALPLPVGAEDDDDSSELEVDDNDDEGEVIGTGENSDMLISDPDDQSL